MSGPAATRSAVFGLSAVAMIAIAALGGWVLSTSPRGASAPPAGSSPAASTPAAAPAGDLSTLLRGVDIVPVAPAVAPAFALPTLDGKRLTLAELHGRPALLYFWASW